MSAFLIARRDCRDWDLPVFHAGDAESIVMFTNATRAATYLRETRLDHDHKVCEVSAVELIEVMVAAHEDGVAFMAINPEAQRQSGGGRQRVLPIDVKFAEFAADLERDVLRRGPLAHHVGTDEIM